jgi:hypothetical protein
MVVFLGRVEVLVEALQAETKDNGEGMQAVRSDEGDVVSLQTKDVGPRSALDRATANVANSSGTLATAFITTLSCGDDMDVWIQTVPIQH